MKEQLQTALKNLIMERAAIKSLLRNLELIDQEDVDPYLDRLLRIEELIEILEQELKKL